MQITHADINFCLDEAQMLTELYMRHAIAADNPKRSVRQTLWMARDYLGKKVTINQFDEDVTGEVADESIYGMYEANTDGSYEIFVIAKLNHCWSRFVLCKELFHVVMDRPEFRSMSIYENIEEYSTAFPLPEEPDRPVISEVLAEIAAMEFLFPYSARVAELRRNDAPDSLALAQKYKIPQKYVEKYLSTHWMGGLAQIMAKRAT